MTAALAASGITRRFGDLVAVDHVDLEVPEGEIYGFLGPNGAGKSTCVRMLCTLLTPSEGTAEVVGYDLATSPHEIRLRIGVALQDAALDEMQTGMEILRLQGRMFGLSEDMLAQRLADVRRLIDIGDAIDRRVSTYSGGMARRLDLAAALVHRPQLLFLDEPTTGLDPVSRQRVWDEVTRLRDELGITIFLTTQYLEEADVLADRVGIINEGRIVVEGTPEELKQRVGADLITVVLAEEADTDEARRAVEDLGELDVHDHQLRIAVENGAAVVSKVAVRLAEAGQDVAELTLRRPTLDDVFLEVTGERLQEDER